MLAEKLSWRQKIGFSIGDFGLNLYWQSLSFFLIYFYTDSIGISATAAGFIFMGATMFEACIDPGVGAFIDRFQTPWGRYRPWVLAGSITLGLAFSFLYWRPQAGGSRLIGLLITVQLAFRLLYTVVAVPFSALTSRMTDSSSERTTLAGLRMLFATAAGALVAYCTQPLAGINGQGDAEQGAMGAAIGIAVLATVALMVAFSSATEGSWPEERAHSRLTDYLRGVLANQAFISLVIGLLFASVSATTVSRVAIYYFKYVIGQESAVRYALALSAGAAFLAVPAWMALGRVVGKRGMWLVALGLGLMSLTLFMLLRPMTQWGATAFFATMQVSNIGVSVAYWSMLPDTVEYGAWRTGIRQESYLFGLFSFFQKLGLGISAGLFGWALDLNGYLPAEQQSSETVSGIGHVIGALCAVGLVGSAVAMYFSPLKHGMHEKLIERLSIARSSKPTPDVQKL